MSKLSKNEEIEKLKQALMERIKLEGDSRYIHLSSDEIMKIIIESSNNGKYVFWALREYLKNNIQRFEDIESRCKQALILFKNNLSKFTEQQKQLNKMSFQELETLIEPYQDVLTQNAVKRMNKEKIWSEIEVVYDGPEGRIYSPKTEEASIFLGQGTKWCTAATNRNMFEYYNQKGPLYIFITNEKDKEGREPKYQLHFETDQFMCAKDSQVKEIPEDLKNLFLIFMSEKVSEKSIFPDTDIEDLFMKTYKKRTTAVLNSFVFFRYVLILFLSVVLSFVFTEDIIKSHKNDIGKAVKVSLVLFVAFVPLFSVWVFEKIIYNGAILKENSKQINIDLFAINIIDVYLFGAFIFMWVVTTHININAPLVFLKILVPQVMCFLILLLICKIDHTLSLYLKKELIKLIRQKN